MFSLFESILYKTNENYMQKCILHEALPTPTVNEMNDAGLMTVNLSKENKDESTKKDSRWAPLFVKPSSKVPTNDTQLPDKAIDVSSSIAPTVFNKIKNKDGNNKVEAKKLEDHDVEIKTTSDGATIKFSSDADGELDRQVKVHATSMKLNYLDADGNLSLKGRGSSGNNAGMGAESSAVEIGSDFSNKIIEFLNSKGYKNPKPLLDETKLKELKPKGHDPKIIGASFKDFDEFINYDTSSGDEEKKKQLGYDIADVFYTDDDGTVIPISIKDTASNTPLNLGLKSNYYEFLEFITTDKESLNIVDEFLQKIKTVGYTDKKIEDISTAHNKELKNIFNKKSLLTLLNNSFRSGKLKNGKPNYYYAHRVGDNITITESYKINFKNLEVIGASTFIPREGTNYKGFKIITDVEDNEGRKFRKMFQIRNRLGDKPSLAMDIQSTTLKEPLNEKRTVQVEFMDDTEAMEFKKEMEERYGVNRASRYALPKGTGKRGTVFVESKLFNKILGETLKEGSNYGHGRNDVYHLNSDFKYKHNCRNPDTCTTGDIVVSPDGDEFMVGRKIKSKFEKTMDNGARQMVFGKERECFETDDPTVFVETEYDTFMEREIISLRFE